MPALQPYVLVRAVLDAIQDSSCSAVLLSPAWQHPRKFLVSNADGTGVLLWVYVWTLTHGGRPSLPHEYRIQMTTVSSPLTFNPSGPTVLLGYEPNLKMLAGFDLNRHRSFTKGSPSVQIDVRTVREALQHGLAFDRKGNNEIAIGVRPDQFLTYLRNVDELHRLGTHAGLSLLLSKASSLQTIAEEEVKALAPERRRLVQTISRLSRQANFRQQVLHAYGNRCAVTGMQLRLIDAAHILPVGAPDSADDVQNGIALSPTYHRAFDSGLIYLDEDLTMKIHAERESALETQSLDGGLEQFKASLGRILRPPDKRQWPNPVFIRKANRYRQIRGSSVVA